MTEPILPVGPDGITEERWQTIVAALKPELFVNVGLDEQASAAAAGQLRVALTSWSAFTGDPPGFPWLWCHPLVADGPAGDAPLPVPAETSLSSLAGVGAVEDFMMWEIHGPGIQRHADGHRCALTQVTRSTVIWATARGVTEVADGSALPPPVPAVIWVSGPDSFTDAVGFWNARALVATVAAPTTPVTAILLPPDISEFTELAGLLTPRFQARYKRPKPDGGVKWLTQRV